MNGKAALSVLPLCQPAEVLGRRLGMRITVRSGCVTVLAVVLASFTGNLWIAVFAIGGGLLYAALTLSVGRVWLERLFVPREADDKRRGTVIPLTLMLVTACAWLTDSM